uniref:RelA/SpoT domain-containing protein n=2 Tax=Ditylum brightwellii TaxID=49249 RepID=A0A7S4SJ21_9STRA|mmetsp:Transcript_43231/g.65325  ORF Transcript_43231/g.65325 Transcript_43231/m.65325 type:complete len:568 (+) Transcript_43231:148-1851(+)
MSRRREIPFNGEENMTTEQAQEQSLFVLLDLESGWLSDLGSDLQANASVSEKAEHFYKNTVGFLQSKAVLDEAAERKLPRKFMDSVPSFKAEPASLQLQMPLDASDPDQMDLDALYEIASLTLTKFKLIVTNIVLKVGLDPEESIQFDQELDVPLQHLVLAPLKGRGRALEKIRTDYGGKNAKLLDIVRCSIIVHTEEELFGVAEALESESGEDDAFRVIRCKNRFKEPLFNGYRDALYTIRVPIAKDGEKMVEHCCEVQVHLSELIFHKSTSHIHYEFFRSYFSGNVEAADERMMVLERVVGAEPNDTLKETIDSSIATTDDNTTQLEALLQLLGEDNMTQYLLASLVAYRLLTVSLESTDDKSRERPITMLIRLGRLLRLAYKYDQAETVLSKTRQAASILFGSEHRLTLLACENHAILMAETRRYEESKSLHRETLETREHVLGPEDPDTLSSCQVLAIVLDKPGHYEEARPYFARAYEGRRKVLGSDHRDTLDSANGLAVIDMMNGQYDSAESIFRATIKVQKEKYGLDHAKTKWTGNNLAGLLMITGRDKEAEKLGLELGLS